MQDQLDNKFYEELKVELHNIQTYWIDNSIDLKHGGFYGLRDHYNTLMPKSNKGIILNSRILWSFSAIENYEDSPALRPLMDRSFDYLYTKFRDVTHGGVFWELDYEGNPVDRKKQIYAQAFTIYAVAEYYRYSKNNKALEWAVEIFDLIETKARDTKLNGYIEAFAEDWSPMQDMRLSDKDQNVAKTMNTHLHILEAYTTLYQVQPNDAIKKALKNIIDLFLTKFLNSDYNFELFFDENWNLVSNTISFGHDIEALWLLAEAASTIDNQDLIKKIETISVSVADVFLAKGYIKNGGVLNELDRQTGELDADRHWWPQVEAMVGLLYAHSITPKTEYLDAIKDIWEFVKTNIIDFKNGEWHFRIDENFKPYPEEDKLSMWKCPYHNSRALVKLLRKDF